MDEEIRRALAEMHAALRAAAAFFTELITAFAGEDPIRRQFVDGMLAKFEGSASGHPGAAEMMAFIRERHDQMASEARRNYPDGL